MLKYNLVPGVPLKLIAYDGTVLGVVYVTPTAAENLNRTGRSEHGFVKNGSPKLNEISSIAGEYHRFILEVSSWQTDSVCLLGVSPEMLDDVPGFAFAPGIRFATWTSSRIAERSANAAAKPIDPGPYLRAARDAV